MKDLVGDMSTKLADLNIEWYEPFPCDWCHREATWTVDYEECQHHAVCCDECWFEYFSGESWLGDTAERPTCTG